MEGGGVEKVCQNFYLIHPLYLDCLLMILGFRVFFCVFCFIVQHHSSNFRIITLFVLA